MRGLSTLALIAVSASASSAAAGQIVAQPPRCPPNADCVLPMPRPMGQRIVRTASSVRVTLDGRVLRYEISETLVNQGNVVGEADYLLPLPRGAAFEDLALEINGELVTGETMNADRARGIYQEIVRKMRDPALVEWMDYGLLRTRIFPIAPGETKRVEVRFRAVAQREGSALRVEYLAGGRTAGSVEIGSAPSLLFLYPRGDAYGTPYSPTHQLDESDSRFQNARAMREVRVRGDASRLTLLVPVRDAGRATVAALPFAPPGEDGFALITLSPPVRRGAAIPRDVTFVIDVSGSMGGQKMEQAKAAGLTLLGTLGPTDRFRLISFSTDVEEFSSGWSPATSEQLRSGRQWLESLRASGSTNIEGALRRALEADATRGRLGMVLFLTDGAATVGERNAERLAELAARERGSQRVFTFGVGADVQAAMLERMAIEGHGTAHFVQPNEDVEHAVGVVAQRLTAPVATNVRLVADGVILRNVHPSGAQDVFVGQDLVLFARYRGAGPATLTFEGDSPTGPVRWTERVNLPAQSRENGFVAKLWAVQRVGWLSAERRRAGANTELDNELRDLGTKYGIPTELSSYLVLEPGMQPMPVNTPGTTRRDSGAGSVGMGRGGPPATAPATDFAATREAAQQRAAKSLADANAVPVRGNMSREEAERADRESKRQVGERTFLQKDGQWFDTRVRDSVRRVSVKPFTPAYFDLIDKLPELKAMFALGERVSAGGRNVVLVLDAQGAERLSASELAGIVRDW